MFPMRRSLVGLVLLTVLTALAGCGQANQPASSSAGSQGETQAAAAPSSGQASSQGSGQPAAQPEPVRPPLKLGVVTSRSGPFEPWGTDFMRGFEIGLDYATDGTQEVAGRKIEVIVKDDQGKPDIGKQMAIELFERDQVDVLFGSVSSAVVLQILPVLEQYQRVMIVEPAASDAITTTAFTRYAFRTGSNTSQDALAGAKGAARLGKRIMQLAPDYDWGRASAQAWREVMEAEGATVVGEVYVPLDATDFVPFLKQVEAQAPEVLVVHWSNAQTGPKLFGQIVQLGLSKKMKISGGIADMRSMKALTQENAGQVGMTKYFHTLPNNPVNDHFVAEYKKRFNEPPELFSAGGMAAAIAIVTALEQTQGDADAEKLIATMEGMSFDSPKGTMTFRKEDHQALQAMYVAELRMNPGFDFPTPSLLMELAPEETAPPVKVGQ